MLGLISKIIYLLLLTICYRNGKNRLVAVFYTDFAFDIVENVVNKIVLIRGLTTQHCERKTTNPFTLHLEKLKNTTLTLDLI